MTVEEVIRTVQSDAKFEVLSPDKQVLSTPTKDSITADPYRDCKVDIIATESGSMTLKLILKEAI